MGLIRLSLALMLGGWAVLMPMIIARSRRHFRRMAEGDGDPSVGTG